MHVRGIFLATVNLRLLVAFVKGNITFQFAIRAIAQTGDNSVAPTMVIAMACWIPNVPVMLALLTRGNPGETMRYQLGKQ